MNTAKDTLILAYNADAGVFNAVSDSVSKVFSNDAYECSLCAVTHGLVSMRHEWRKFLGSLPVDKQFYHREEFARAFPGVNASLPVIMLAREQGKPEILIKKDELNAIVDLSELIGLTQQRLAQKRRSVPG